MTKQKYKPTQAVLDNIQRGVATSAKYPRDSMMGQRRAQSVEVAKHLNKVDFDIEEVKKVYNILQPLEKSLDFDKRLWDSGPTDEVITYYSFGGASGLAWSRSILKDLGMLVSQTREITKAETEEVGTDSVGSIGVLKSVDEMQRMATFVILEPQDESGLTSDLHGDYYDAKTVEKACRSFNNQCKKANLFHAIETTAFAFIESYVTPADMIINETFIKKGTWLATIQVSEEPEYEFIWQGILSGEFNGLSIQARGKLEQLVD